MNRILSFIAGPLLCLSLLAPAYGQTIIFEATFNATLESAEGEKPNNTTGVEFTTGLQGEGILVDQGDVLQYALADNIDADQGSITLWVKPDWVPGDTLRRIMLVENSPVFELHVDEGANLVLAMFSDEIETRVGGAYVGDWKRGDWHFLVFNWNSERIEIFVDGNKIGETAVGFDIPAFEAGVFNVGASGENFSFDGVLDELKIYDAPLTTSQVQQDYETTLSNLPNASAISVKDLFGREVTQTGITLVDWEGPVRNPAMKYFLQGNAFLSYPLSVKLTTREENTSFNLPSDFSPKGASKTLVLDSQGSLASFLFSFYMDEDFEGNAFELTLSYNLEGLPAQQVIPVTVIDQDYDRSLSYPVTIDFSEVLHPFMQDPSTQAIINQAAEDWLYYVDGEGIDEIEAGGSSLVIGGQDHLFEEKTVVNPIPYKGYYLYAYGNTNEGPCVCSTGFPNRELLQSSGGEEVPIFRIGGLHLNVFGQAFETEPTGWAALSPFDNWSLKNPDGSLIVPTDLYSLAKHEIGHAMVYENSPLLLAAQGRDPNNPFPDESVPPTPNGFRSQAISTYYPGGVIPLYPNSLTHIIDVLDPASQTPPYGGGVPVEVMPIGREMLTKLDILIMESVGYPLRENEVTRPLALHSTDGFRGELETDFTADLTAEGGIPVYDFELLSGALPLGLSLDRRTGQLRGIPEEEGAFPVSFLVKDYDERSQGATFDAIIRVGIPLSNKAELISFTFDSTLIIVDNTIDSAAQTIFFTVEPGTDITNLPPQIKISEGATISPAADEPQDFTNPVAYTITSEDGSTSLTWTIIFDFVSSVQEELRSKLSIYPNPANQELVVEIRGSNKEPLRFQLFNLQGQMVRNGDRFWQEVRIPLYDLSSGVYFLKVIDSTGKSTTQRIMVEH